MSHFIVIEGLDGTGKTTQIKLLESYLASKGEKVFTTAEPTALPTGKLLRRILGGEVESDPWSTAALFYSDRIQHCAGTDGISSHLANGETVITDRYYFSTFAYQGMDTDLDAIMNMHYSCPKIVHPDLVIFLTMSPEDCMRRIKANRGDDEIEIFESTEILTRVSQRFDTVFKKLGDRENIVTINAGGTIEEVAAQIQLAVDTALYGKKKELLLFDMDGTVIDNSEGIINCIRYSLDKMGKPCPDEKTLRLFVGPSLFDSYTDLIENNPENAEIFIAGYRERYAPVGTTEVKLYPDMEKLLKTLSADGYTLGVVSSKPLPFVQKIAKHLGIFDLFGVYCCPDFASHVSDKTQLLNDAISHFGRTKEDALMIGDTVFDIAAAHGADVKALWVSYGFGKETDFTDDKPDLTAASCSEIYRIITGKEL